VDPAVLAGLPQAASFPADPGVQGIVTDLTRHVKATLASQANDSDVEDAYVAAEV
jgi:hypothetical protein